MKNFLYILLFIISGSGLYAQLSPGELTDSHKNLEGMSNCTKCHEIGEPVHNSKCTECHTEIKELIDSKRGYHSSSEVADKDCSDCHSEHHGRNFKIIKFDKNNFDHDLTGYVLEGKHKEAKCADCHKPDNIPNSKLKKSANTYLGLSSRCINCHNDYHQNTLSGKCENCHGFNTFRPAPRFNHSSTNFILEGAHKNVKCENCHKKSVRNEKEFQVFKGVKFGSCIECHNDIHKGKFGSDCVKCHSTASFRNIINKVSFNHEETGFKLIGKHRSVECKQCHKNGLTVKLKSEKCIDCHKDFHNGQFLENGMTRDCSSCHNEKRFNPSLFTMEKHNETKFQLLGGHLAVPCESCHFKKNNWVFRFDNFNCINCHENIHGSTISQKYWDDGNCETCHNNDSWHIVNFDHSSTKFELLGTHKNIKCGACHLNKDNSNNKYRFSQLSRACEDCHKDVHNAQFQTAGKTNCGVCHAFMTWEPVKFSHKVSRFKLDGAHQNVACAKCHPKINSNGSQYVQFKFSEIKCSNCHL